MTGEKDMGRIIESLKIVEKNLVDQGRPKELVDLPSTHPLVAEWEQSKKKYNEQQDDVAKKAAKKVTKKGKRRVTKAKRKIQQQESDNLGEVRDSCQGVNTQIEKCQFAVRELAELLEGSEDSLKRVGSKNRTRVLRLDRMLLGFYRALEDSKFNMSRIGEDG